MSFGAEFRNNTGIIQIDSNYGNYYLSQSGSSATTSISGTGTGVSSLLYPQSWLVVSVTGVNPLIAFNSSQRTFLYNVTQSGSTWTFTLATMGAIGTIINYYIYDTYPTTLLTGWGLNIYDAAGKVTFSSNRKYLRVIDQIAGPYSFVSGNSNWHGDSFSYAAGRTYAVIQSHLAWANDPFTFFGYIVGLLAQFSGTSLTLYDERLNQSGRPYEEPYGDLEFVDRVTYLVVDVTGH